MARKSRRCNRRFGLYRAHAGRRGGSGTFAAFQRKEAVKNSQSTAFGGLDIDILAETTSPFAMNIAVSIVAPEMIRLATIYMSTRDLATLKKQLEELETIVTDAERFSELESAFMQTIARGTHNALVEGMYSILNEERRSPQWAASRRQRLTPMKIKSVQLLFRSLYQAMERRNVETAVETIKLHIANSHEEMLYESCFSANFAPCAATAASSRWSHIRSSARKCRMRICEWRAHQSPMEPNSWIFALPSQIATTGQLPTKALSMPNSSRPHHFASPNT